MQGLSYYTGAWMEDESAAISRGLRSRDPELLDWLIEQYQHRLYRYLVFFTRDPQLSEDLFQDTWMRVLEKASQFDPRYKFENWLLRVARNLAIDQMRRRNPASLAAEIPFEEDGPMDLPDRAAATSAFDQLAAEETREMLGRVMDAMPPYYREVLTLRFHEGLSLAEIAEVSDVGLSTVKSRLRRALGMLSTRLEGSRP